MPSPPDKRTFGLSPRARRFVLPVLIFAALLIVITYFATKDANVSAGHGPLVGHDLHAINELGGRLFVGGHRGAGFRESDGGWQQVDSLDDRDVMAWAVTGSRILAGGHAGLYSSTDGGKSFDKVAKTPVSDVHALGASGDSVYLASPRSGLLVSTDGGRTFEPGSTAGQTFMGSIWVDPRDPETAIAPSMQDGVVKTTDGGKSWSQLGSAAGAMAIAVTERGDRLLAVGMNGAEATTDGGATWTPAEVPSATIAATYTARGTLLVATLQGDRAELYEQVGARWRPLA